MILVFVELGGERLLGKARELADICGFRVTAVCSSENKGNAERYIALGADDVIAYNAKSVSEWMQVFSEIIKTDSQLRLVLFPSNIIGNLILGGVYSSVPEKIGSFADNVESVNESEAMKSLHSIGRLLRVTAIQDKVSAWSVKLSSVPEPFEDSSRYGKVKDGQAPRPPAERVSTPSLSDFSEEYQDASTQLSILYGQAFSGEGEMGLLAKLASKYQANLLPTSGAVQVVYGPCIAVEVMSGLRELPQFNGDLISLNTSGEAPIASIANLAIVSTEIGKVLERLLG